MPGTKRRIDARRDKDAAQPLIVTKQRRQVGASINQWALKWNMQANCKSGINPNMYRVPHQV
jgi:hypothetical protein